MDIILQRDWQVFNINFLVVKQGSSLLKSWLQYNFLRFLHMSKKVNIKPLGGNVLIKTLEDDKKTASGIVLPDTAEKERKQKGSVVALGTGKLDKDGKKIPFNVSVGDIVVFKKYSPEEIEVDGVEYLIMDENDLLAVVS